MKKRILLLIPCILLALGLLTACGDNGSGVTGSDQPDNTIKEQLVKFDWEGKASGDGQVSLPFGLGDLLTFEFNDDGTGSLSFLEDIDLLNFDFTWTVQDGEICLDFKQSTFGDMSFYMNKNTLVLKTTGLWPIEITLNPNHT